MAVSAVGTHVESVAAILADPGDDFPSVLRTVWAATDLTTGIAYEFIIDAAVASDAPLDQTAWDAIYADFMTAWALIGTGTGPVANPVDIT